MKIFAIKFNLNYKIYLKFFFNKVVGIKIYYFTRLNTHINQILVLFFKDID